MCSDPPGVAHPKVTGRYPNPPWPKPVRATRGPVTERDTERGRLRVNATCVIRLDELEWRTTGSGGPGGQHANTSDTRVEVRFPIATSTSLAPRQRERLLERLGPVARATASDSRSQARNREVALERLRARLADALHLDPPRAIDEAHEVGQAVPPRRQAPPVGAQAGPPAPDRRRLKDGSERG